MLIAQTMPGVPEVVSESLSSNFTLIDWAVLLGYLIFVTILGIRLAGKQQDINDFFRGGNQLPWYAVAGSMIATIISAVTFVAVPSIAYAASGNFTYLQFGLIAGLISRLFVAFFLVPAYYEQQVFSPYDYMSLRLGEAARSVSTALFSLMGVLAQASRVYLTAIILQLVLQDQLSALSSLVGISPLALSIFLVGLVAIVWTMAGGIATVIWTDTLLFLIFVIGGIIAISVVATEVPGGLATVLREGAAAGKFQLFSFSSTPPDDAPTRLIQPWANLVCRPYTLWAAIFAVTFGNIGSYGTDQLLAQRIFTCRSQRDAQLAVVVSWAAELVAALMLLVGVGLWAYYQHFPDQLAGAAADAVADKRDNIFPVFILTQVPVVLRGLIVAGIFAAAISSLTSILAALSQTTLSAVYLPLVGLSADQPIPPERNRQVLATSRVLIVIWGIALCATALAIDRYVAFQEANNQPVFFLDLALGLANYVVGTLFALFLLAWLPLRCNAHGLIWSAPLSVFCVLATRFHDPWIYKVCGAVTGGLVLTWLAVAMTGRPAQRMSRLIRTYWLTLGCALMFAIAHYLWFPSVSTETEMLVVDSAGFPLKTSVAWPWYAPIGGTVAFVFGYLLADRREREHERVEVEL